MTRHKAPLCLRGRARGRQVPPPRCRRAPAPRAGGARQMAAALRRSARPRRARRGLRSCAAPAAEPPPGASAPGLRGQGRPRPPAPGAAARTLPGRAGRRAARTGGSGQPGWPWRVSRGVKRQLRTPPAPKPSRGRLPPQRPQPAVSRSRKRCALEGRFQQLGTVPVRLTSARARGAAGLASGSAAGLGRRGGDSDSQHYVRAEMGGEPG